MTEILLETRNLRKSFGALCATDDVSLTLRAGEIHALIGPNGAGKSTLIAQIMGGLRPDAGQVVFAGQDITNWPTPARARAGLGRTFQISSLAMEHTVLQNAVLGALGRNGRVMLFLRPVMKDTPLVAQADAAAERVGLQERGNELHSEGAHRARRIHEPAVALPPPPRPFARAEPA